jgi:capsular exopolysaccharide synthesis family protein
LGAADSVPSQLHPLHLDFTAGSADWAVPTGQGEMSQGRDQESTQAPELPIDDKQRHELLKFVQQFILVPGAPRIIMLVGSESGNGCTWISSRAAQILASQVKGGVCLVDGNLRSPGLHQAFAIGNHHGLTDALQGTESIRKFLRPLITNQNLWLLSCGATPPGRDALLSSEPLKRRISELRRYFDYVLIDSPALSVGPDATVLGRAAEGVVLVLKANSSRREAARKAVQDLQRAGVRVLGAILNHRTFPIPQSIYSRL